MKRLFLSYSRADKEYVKHLVDVLRKQDFDVWFDEQIPTGQDWDDVLEAQLKQSDAMILVLSKTSVASENVKDEIAFAKHNDVIIAPIKIEECNVPLRMMRTQFIDFTKGFDLGAQRLVDDLRAEFANEKVLGTATSTSPQKPRRKIKPVNTQKKPWKAYIIGAVVAIVLPIILVSIFSGDEDTAEDATMTEQVESGQNMTQVEDWNVTYNLDTIEGYIAFMEEYGPENPYYDEIYGYLNGLMSSRGYIEFMRNDEQQVMVEYFNKSIDPDEYPLPDNVIMSLTNCKIFETPMFIGESAVMKDDILLEGQAAIIVDIVQDPVDSSIWLEIAYK